MRAAVSKSGGSPWRCAGAVWLLLFSAIACAGGNSRVSVDAELTALLAPVAPELRPAAARIAGMPRPAFTTEALPSRRAALRQFEQPPLPDIPFEKRTIPGPAGAPDVTVYLINIGGGQRPAILHTHGGGYIAGSPAQDLPRLQRLAQALDCVIVSVDYRLAPETTWQGSGEDNYAALKWLHDHAAELGVDRQRLAVMGESAGGGHAALLALMARDRGQVSLIFQMLIYPMLDDRTASTREVPAPLGELIWTAEANRFGWRAFLGQEPGTTAVPAAAVPARAGSLAGLPPAFIAVGGLDLFVQENIAYAQRLIAAGVPTELLVLPGAFHAFDVVAEETALARRFSEARVRALREAFAQRPE